MRRTSLLAILSLFLSWTPCHPFVSPQETPSRGLGRRDVVERHSNSMGPAQSRALKRQPTTSRILRPNHSSSTSLGALIEVPMGFFAISFAGAGVMLSLSKQFARYRMEENAWEQRLAEGRQERLRNDPTLTELDLRRQEAAMEWSAYGKPRMEEQEAMKEKRGSGQRRRVKVMDREDYDEEFDDHDPSERGHRMTDKEIDAFELEFGIDYDPYYDDPYTEDQLPEGKYTVSKKYGDRMYETGETFFKDKSNGLFYRQGAKPRNVSFWSQ